jgi:heat shock protein HslJ
VNKSPGLRAPTFAALLLAFSACHAAPPPKMSDKLTGRRFLLQAVEGAELLVGIEVQLHFSGDFLSFSAQCNHMDGRYSIEQAHLVVGSVGQTEMGCEPKAHEQDEWLSKFFTSKPALALDGAKLIVSSGSTRLSFLDREVADPDRPLTGMTWEVGTYIDGDTAMGLMGIESPRITFAADSSWQARGTCLEGTGTYTVSGDQLTLANARFVETACKEDNDKEAAAFVRSVLVDGALSYTIDARQLTLKRGARGLAAHGK